MDGLELSEVNLLNLEYSFRFDAEYYKPTMLYYESIIENHSGSKLLSDCADFLIGPFGSAFTVDNYTEDRTYRYIRGKDVKPLQLMDNDNVYMPESDYNRLIRYALKENDILVSVVGTIGNAALVMNKDLPGIFSCKSTVVRVRGIQAPYLLAYLNCKFGQSLLLRKERGAVQKGLNLDDLKTLNVFIPNDPNEFFQSEISKLFVTSCELLAKSKEIYKEAEELLKIIEKDALVITTLLKTANSSLFGFRSKVESVGRVINLLGINFTIYVTISETINNLLATDLTPYNIKSEDFIKASTASSNLVNLWVGKIDNENFWLIKSFYGRESGNDFFTPK